MTRNIVLAIAAAAALLGTGAAQAARVDFSVGIAVPPIAVAVGGPGFVRDRWAPPVEVSAVGYPAAVLAPVVVAPRPRIWLPPLPRLAPPPWAWHHGDRHDGWREADHRDGRRDDGRHDGDHHDGWRDANHRGTRGPW